MVLMVCQAAHLDHCEGAAQVLKVYHKQWPLDPPRHKLCMSVCVTVLVEALFTKGLCSSNDELRRYAKYLKKGTGDAGIVLSALCEANIFLNMCEERSDSCQGDIDELASGIRTTCDQVAASREELRHVRNLIRTAILAGKRGTLPILLGQLERFEVFTIAVSLLLNLIAFAFIPYHRERVLSKNSELVDEALLAASSFDEQTPLGATHVSLVLVAAWIAAIDRLWSTTGKARQYG
ncbi:hypothetical protein LTR62_006877 [Meristemomyces frigidus]|uniref:Uncharacterized protein n=1 Tax=Meristemomyces frigidus TaxID=1508187 RepID=A0AAN7YPN4_9PEZI|nr:hypothetical protein LTR62_006877 [Meristemomyces frigidus]